MARPRPLADAARREVEHDEPGAGGCQAQGARALVQYPKGRQFRRVQAPGLLAKGGEVLGRVVLVEDRQSALHPGDERGVVGTRKGQQFPQGAGIAAASRHQHLDGVARPDEAAGCVVDDGEADDVHAGPPHGLLTRAPVAGTRRVILKSIIWLTDTTDRNGAKEWERTTP